MPGTGSVAGPFTARHRLWLCQMQRRMMWSANPATGWQHSWTAPSKHTPRSWGASTSAPHLLLVALLEECVVQGHSQAHTQQDPDPVGGVVPPGPATAGAVVGEPVVSTAATTTDDWGAWGGLNAGASVRNARVRAHARNQAAASCVGDWAQAGEAKGLLLARCYARACLQLGAGGQHHVCCCCRCK
ncbi:hypothetical protein COO60DRAFT_875133 [Scenedesmus sp. NREL 46B-D3]|nr:hypothetical protein COO60DRAFT_875133 [Scenedesmus sp. NREL 46B-D3]